ncbi:hypothetical protein ACM8BJ_30950 [Pseudomonas aeruginosa]|uniref:hypothetical protein n=1 Tax=Pseudomonas aeruginosa TaxID=287 RepID=UPI00051F26A5|nr:hypothetical protein [Pseudomonas aeruginosa]EJK6085919.1 hypothetical protein [Pseudomonas aeruginosa]EKD5495119.1 hypothetical protein [Pseudomonas aeruginosa]EKD5524974.1 hypothetical protein [Pseudomonas aeruginosa]EKD5562741.1 hypothetical protein [Pseudomonas aeruginosa]EKD5595651.1 hypothetical protein [Pseudomonas aeruginosa]
MEIFHTSPVEITTINTQGRFGEFLCFAADEYVMTAGDHVTYRIKVDESDIIMAGSIFYHERAADLSGLVERVMQLTGCDEDTAEELISQRIDVFSLDDIDASDAAELSWDIQAITAQAAKTLGFRGVSMQDEQGTCYMIDMLGHDAELVRVK